MLRRVRIVLHAGLHKSGTTSIQDTWRRHYGDHARVWYPTPPPGPPGHHRLMRPLVQAFVQGLAPDLLVASLAYHARPGRHETIGDVVASARDRGVETLVLSSEVLDRVRPDDVPGLRAAWGAEDVTLVLTVTDPTHRWCSGWQTLVKHGLAEYPADAARHVVGFAALESGRLEEIVSLIPATQTVIRLVRRTPPEPGLATDLATSLGLPPILDRGPGVLNQSLGTDTEVVLRINRADLGLGTDRDGLAALERLRGDGFLYREAPGLATRYALPRAVLDAARREADWLQGVSKGSSHVRLLDPHGLLESWSEGDLPGWYETISRRQAIVDELDGASDRELQLWRVRQQRSALQRRLRRLSDAPSTSAVAPPGPAAPGG